MMILHTEEQHQSAESNRKCLGYGFMVKSTKDLLMGFNSVLATVVAESHSDLINQ